VLGELELLPPGLQRAAAGVMAATWHHNGPVLNVCFAYTGRGDIAQVPLPPPPDCLLIAHRYTFSSSFSTAT